MTVQVISSHVFPWISSPLGCRFLLYLNTKYNREAVMKIRKAAHSTRMDKKTESTLPEIFEAWGAIGIASPV
jgi:S-ribosylhomocysteine lyase LuxS involved in autoinducer biosynthesis